jgi:hypothetical protein
VHTKADGAQATLVDAHGETPTEVLQRLTDGAAAMYRTDRSARRTRSLARTTWLEFLAIAQRGQQECLVEVPFEDPNGEEQRREHIWMRVEDVQQNAVIATPVHAPLVAVGVDMGQQRIEAKEVASWRVMVQNDATDAEPHAWGPEQLGYLKEALEQ